MMSKIHHTQHTQLPRMTAASDSAAESDTRTGDDAHQPLLLHEQHSAASTTTIDMRDVRKQQKQDQKKKENTKKEKSENQSNEEDDADKKKSKQQQVHRTSPSDDFDGKYAVDVQGLTHSYGGKKAKPTLSEIDLQIEKGKIYGLLGPSGCGKTTLIKCILAQLDPSEGVVLCFGEKPGSELSAVPGCDVGYMPQELALYDEFSVLQNLNFYAKLFGMTSEEFENRSKYICKLLELDKVKKKAVGKLSGGQQRRCSLACSLLHSPKLLILDEPTVGVDPTLRTKIWKYLTKISKEEGTSILLTTHYIEEARRAHTVGLMRDGRMLRQGTPKEIMEEAKSKTLEAAFLKICNKDEKNDDKKKKENGEDTSSSETDDSSDDDDEKSSMSSEDDENENSDSKEEEEEDDQKGTKATYASESSVSHHPRHSPLSSRDSSSTHSNFSDLSPKDYTATRGDFRKDKNSKTKDVNSTSFRKEEEQDARKDNNTRETHDQKSNRDSNSGSNAKPLTGWSKISTKLALPRRKQLWGLVWKNCQRMIHGIAAMIFQFILPSLQVILFCLAIGKDPMRVHLGVVNQDAGANSEMMQQIQSNILTAPTNNDHYMRSMVGMNDTDLQPGFLSHDYETFLSDHFIIDKYDSLDHAVDDVKTNAIWGYIHIPTNFTQNTITRILNPLSITNDTLENSTLTYTLDMSNEQMTVFLLKGISESYSDVVQKYVPGVEKLAPLQMRDPIYGNPDASFTDFVAPGIIITIAFSSSIGLTAITFVLDKKIGVMSRQWSAGVWASEVMLAQLITQLLIFFIQIGLLLIFGLLAFKLPIYGSVVLLFSICLLLGITGMMFGLVIASKVTEERDAMQCALGSFFPALLLSGVMWPIEAIPSPLYYFSLALPTTWAAEAGRSLMSRGWGLEHKQVWLGIVVPLAWSFFFFIWAARSLRAKK